MLTLPNLQENVPLAPYTTFKIGGPAKYFIVVKTKDALVQAIQEAKKANIQWFILGGGSDILVSDNGFDGLCIKMELREVEFDDERNTVRAQAGVRMSALITQCIKRERENLEFAIGVPATVGGAVWANLGARGSEVKNFLREITVLDEEGIEHILTPEECQFAYRESIFKHKKFVIVDALFQLNHGNKERITDIMHKLTNLRKETQDISAKTAGCAFRNPVLQTDVPAAKLIDDLGLKGKRMGGAQVSDIHANFIVNTGDATAEDVVMLISYIKQQVRDKKGIQLHEEIEYIGY